MGQDADGSMEVIVIERGSDGRPRRLLVERRARIVRHALAALLDGLEAEAAAPDPADAALRGAHPYCRTDD